MSMSYGSVDLGEIIEIKYSMESVYDETETDFLYNKYRIESKSVLNIDAGLETHEEGVSESRPRVFYGDKSPTEVENILRVRLGEPRRALVIRLPTNKDPNVEGEDAYETLLESPSQKLSSLEPLRRMLLTDNAVSDIVGSYAYDAVDDANGPKPIYRDVRFVGNASFYIHFVVETCFNPFLNPDSGAYRPSGRKNRFGFHENLKNIVLSNRFTMSQDYNELGYSTREVSGVAIFSSRLVSIARQNNLLENRQWADVLRPYFFFPVPKFCMRKQVQVVQGPDGLSYHYSFMDEEDPMVIDPNGKWIHKIEGSHTKQLTQPAVSFSAIGSVADTTLNAINQAAWAKDALQNKKQRPRGGNGNPAARLQQKFNRRRK